MSAKLEVLVEVDWPLEDLKHAKLRRTVTQFLLAESQFDESDGNVVIPFMIWDTWIELLRDACVNESLPLQKLINAAMALLTFQESDSQNPQRYKMLKRRLRFYSWQFRMATDNIPEADADGASEIPVITNGKACEEG